ncbi:MAG TPA: extracellular solute-binding protein, partial [Candidatus Paenibacillus intestinavium]|nr:extracellular solute-binding protein [Candidatus Paenibacillus intestinavium]
NSGGSSESNNKGNDTNARKERVTLKVEVFDRGNSPEGATVTNNEMTKYVQENFGDPNNIDVQFVAIPRSEEINTLNVQMAASTAPDLIFSYNEGAIYSWAQQGGLTDLAPAIEQYGPNLKEYLKDSLQYGVFDGTQYAVVARRVNQEKYSSFIRQDWLDQLKLEIPTTTDETYNVLKAFKDNNLGGARTIPLGFSLTPDSYEPIIWSFIKEQSDEARYLRAITIGSREYPILLDGHKDALQFLNKLYGEGLLDPDFALDKDRKKRTENFVNGYTGMFSADTGTFYGGEAAMPITLEKNVPSASVNNVIAWTDFEGKSYQPKYNPSGMYLGVPVFSERVNEVIQYLNWMAQDEVIQYMAFGEEGVHHELVDGYPIRNGSDADTKLLYNTGDNLIITNGIDFGSPEKNNEYLALNVVEKHRELAMQSRHFSNKDAVAQPIRFNKPLDSEAKYSVVMLEKYEELLVKSIMAKSTDFDKVYDSALNDFMTTAGNEVIEERAAAFAELK